MRWGSEDGAGADSEDEDEVEVEDRDGIAVAVEYGRWGEVGIDRAPRWSTGRPQRKSMIQVSGGLRMAEVRCWADR